MLSIFALIRLQISRTFFLRVPLATSIIILLMYRITPPTFLGQHSSPPCSVSYIYTSPTPLSTPLSSSSHKPNIPIPLHIFPSPFTAPSAVEDNSLSEHCTHVFLFQKKSNYSLYCEKLIKKIPFSCK